MIYMKNDMITGTGNQGFGGYKRGAVEYRTLDKLNIQGSDRSGYRVWHDKLANALAQANRYYRTRLNLIVRAIDKEENSPHGGADEWEYWVAERDWTITADIGRLNADLFSVLLDKTDGDS